MKEKVVVENDLLEEMFEVLLPERYMHIATMRGLLFKNELGLVFKEDNRLRIKWSDFKSLGDEDN